MARDLKEHSLAGMLVCRQIRGGHELVLGLHRDPEMGLVVMAGSGGVLLELVKDVAFCAPPVNRDKARDLLERLRGGKLLRGYRGAPALDAEAAVDALAGARPSCADLEDILQSVDINPFVVLPQGGMALDALIVLAACRGDRDDGTSRKIDVKPEWWDNIFAPSSCLTLITTVDQQGQVNAAAFGTCTRVCHEPMYIAFTCSQDRDTTRNVLATGEFVVNVVPFEQPMLDKVPVCGLPFRPGVNELEKAGLTPIPARVLRPPRIAECRAHFECKVEWTKAWLYRVMICGKVEAVSIDDGCMDADGFIVWDKVKPAHYCGMRYRDRFVPAYDKPTRGAWRYDGRDDEFRAGESWRDAYRSVALTSEASGQRDNSLEGARAGYSP